MTTETVANIILDARRHADAETPTPTVDFTPDLELVRAFNTSYRKLVDLIAESGDAAISLLLKSATLASPYTLPAGFYRAVGVDMLDGTRWRELKQFSFLKRNRRRDDNFPAYRLEGGTLILSPSTAGPTLQLWYIADGGTLTSSDTITTFNGWNDFLAWDIAIEILGKEDRDPSLAMRRRDEAQVRIERTCAELNLADSMVIADVQRVAEDFFDFLG